MLFSLKEIYFLGTDYRLNRVICEIFSWAVKNKEKLIILFSLENQISFEMLRHKSLLKKNK